MVKPIIYPCYYGDKKQNFASAVRVGNLVFCSGETGRFTDGTGRCRVQSVGVQTADALDKIEAALKAAGTSLENIVRIDYLCNSRGLIEFWEGPSMLNYYEKNAPALAKDMPSGTCCGVENLCYPEEMIELNMIAAMPEAKTKYYPWFYSGETKVDRSKRQTFSAANVVDDFVFPSGQTGRLPETGRVRCGSAGVQAVDALETKIKPNLEKAGTSLENIVRIDYWFIGSEGATLWNGPIMDYLRKSAPSLAENMPAVSWLGLRSLCFPEQLVELTVLAVLPEAKTKVKTYPCFYCDEKQNFAAAVRVGDLVFCSGESGRMPETGQVRTHSAAGQAADALDNIKANLGKVGTSLENIVKIDFYFVGNLGETLWDGPIMDYFRKNAPSLAENMPAVARCGLRNLYYPEELVELEVIAVMPS